MRRGDGFEDILIEDVIKFGNEFSFLYHFSRFRYIVALEIFLGFADVVLDSF